MRSSLALPETKAMLREIANRIIGSQALLNDADRMIGDGDHGVGMARGFEAVLRDLDRDDSEDLKALFNKVGTTLITSVGGASGILFGTWFMGGGNGLAGKDQFDNGALLLFLRCGLRAVQERGSAQRGQKTMVDVLAPATTAAEENQQEELPRILERVSRAAAEGMELTKGMVATAGRAKTLGKRSVGYADPGAVSASLILHSMCHYVGTSDAHD
jgi:dihydroxyacetone kinase-like protein